MNAEFFEAIEQIEKEKGIPRTYMYEKIHQAMLTAFRRDNPECADNVEVILDEEKKRIDMQLGGAKQILLKGTAEEKLIVRLLSRSIETIRQDIKVRIEDERQRIDVRVKYMNQMTEAAAKDGLEIEVMLPNRYLDHLEMRADCSELRIVDLKCDNIEFTGKTEHICIEDLEAEFEVDCNHDIDITCNDLHGSLALNQISASSVLYLPADFTFRTVVKGFGNSIIWSDGENGIADFSTPDAENYIELNGLKSTLKIILSTASLK